MLCTVPVGPTWRIRASRRRDSSLPGERYGRDELLGLGPRPSTALEVARNPSEFMSMLDNPTNSGGLEASKEGGQGLASPHQVSGCRASPTVAWELHTVEMIRPGGPLASPSLAKYSLAQLCWWLIPMLSLHTRVELQPQRQEGDNPTQLSPGVDVHGREGTVPCWPRSPGESGLLKVTPA